MGVPLWLSIHWKVKASVLGSVGAPGATRRQARYPVVCWVGWTGAAPAPSEPPVVGGRGGWGCCLRSGLGATLRAHQALLRPADGGSGSGGEGVEAASAYVGTRSGQTTAHCSEC